jgi:hypothetical protein
MLIGDYNVTLAAHYIYLFVLFDKRISLCAMFVVKAT